MIEDMYAVNALKCWQEVDGQQTEIACPDGMLASKEKAEQRMAICKECPSYKALVFMCGECGCIMPAKARINGANCPLGKW